MRRGLLVTWGVLLGLLAGLPRPAQSATQRGVGLVTALRGEVAVQHEEAIARREARPAQEELHFRDDVFFRDVIDTQRESFARMLLRGRSVFTVRELSRVELREGVVPADPARTRSVVSLLTGAFWAVIDRDLRPQDEFEVQTPNAISAVRGTDVVVEVYRDTAPPPLPTVLLEPEVQPASFQVAQAPRIVSRWFVRDGEIEVETVRARPGEGIEKVDNLPPRLFRFAPDFIERLVSRFAVAAVEGPLGAHRAAIVRSHQGQGEEDVGGGPGVPQRAVLPIDPAINSTSFLNNIEFKFSGTFSGTVTQQGGVAVASMNGTYFASSTRFIGFILSGTFSGTNTYFCCSTAINAPFSGSASGTVRGWPLMGTLNIAFTSQGPFLAAFFKAPLMLQGNAVVSTQPFTGIVFESPPAVMGSTTGRVGK